MKTLKDILTEVLVMSDGDKATNIQSRNLPVLPVKDIVIFPQMIVPLFIGREGSILAVNEAAATPSRSILVLTQKDISIDDPAPEDMFDVGCVANIMRTLKLNDGRIKILVQGVSRASVNSIKKEGGYYVSDVTIVDTEEVSENDLVRGEALMRSVRDKLDTASDLGKPILPDLLSFIDGLKDQDRLADMIASNVGFGFEDTQELLSLLNPMERLERISELLSRELSILEVQHKIMVDTRGEIDKSQREYYLREQLKAILKELGEDEALEEEVERFREKIYKSKMPQKAKETAQKEVKRLARMNQDAAEATVVRNYLEWLIELPWDAHTKKQMPLNKSKAVLDADHYGLKDVKERILEFLAVLSLKNAKAIKSPIICLVGPPGVGKTSLGASIAKATSRKFVRISLGSMHDESEIKGHRRTYIGAMPGKLIQAMKTAGTSNPVILLDEIDKVSVSYRGDPFSALLEVLDPQQNHSFVDNYINIPYDLSRVLFIATANYIGNIPAALRDRMDIVQLSGYTNSEKLSIAQSYLIPRQREESGLGDQDIKFYPKALEFIISDYTRESGVRQLEREIGRIYRKIALKKVTKEKFSTTITPAGVAKYLGTPLYKREDELIHNELGVVTGLAWTSVGGDVLYVEALRYKGRGKLNITGSLGDVMKESARAALSYIRSMSTELGIDNSMFEKYDLHIHVPAGATPKDGPSAGITIVTAIISILQCKYVSRNVAMTGEITLRGKVLPIGGLKEKILAAKMVGITTIIIPEGNRKDVEKMEKEVVHGVKIIPIANYMDIMNLDVFVENSEDNVSSSDGNNDK